MMIDNLEDYVPKEEETPCKCKLKDINTSSSPIIWVLGGRGSEKTKLSLMIVEKYDYMYISCGDLLKASGSRQIPGCFRLKTVETVIQQGGSVPCTFVIELLREIMSEQADTAKGFVLNGFPKDKSQGLAFQKKIANPTIIFYFEISGAMMLSNIISPDDNKLCQKPTIDQVMCEIELLLENIEKILAPYPTKVRRINAMRPQEEIFADVCRIIDPVEDLAKLFRIEDEYVARLPPPPSKN